jgi:signal transduction histidine kinase
MSMRTVGDYVRHWRREAGLTRHQLARRAGVSYGYVCQIEANRAGLPREQQLRALAAVLAPSPEDAQMLLDLANQTRVPAHVVHAVLRQNPVVAALLWWLRDHSLPEHGSALMQQLMAPARTDAGAARVGEQNWGAQTTEVPQQGGATPAVSHQLRAPLTSIMSRAELVRRRLDQEQALTAEWLRLQVAAMYEAAECMVASMDEMTDTARLHSGQPLALQVGIVHVGELVSGVAHALNETRAWCGVAPIEVVGSPDAVIVGDSTRLTRVLRTVMEYVAARSGAAATVQVTVRPQGAGVTIAVHDGDVPLPAQERGQRGQPREQAHGPAGVAGMDPELVSACRIVEQHGGYLRLAHASGPDATAPTVLITLPRISALQDGATGAPRRLRRAAS